jgi:serine protease
VLFLATLLAASAPDHVLCHRHGAVHKVVEARDCEFVEPDFVRQKMNERDPDDPMFSLQWALRMVRAPEGWVRSQGSESVVVAVVDTGIRPHPDLDARVLPGFDFISSPESAGDGDGRDADPTDAGSEDPSSSELHGLHIAGIIGAQSDNSLGIAGLDWRCKILPVRVLGVDHGQGLDSDIADAIRWSAGLPVDGAPDNPHPADVINLSFGGAGRSRALQNAVDDALGRGSIVIAAAGNLSHDARNDSPAGLDGVIAIGAAGPDGKLADYSNFGPTVSLLAPGGLVSAGVLSTLPGGYGYHAGTSQAAAFVSGAAALVRSVAPLDAKQMKALLEGTANPSAKCVSPANANSPGCGAGLLDVDAALVTAASCGADCPRPPPPIEVQSGCNTVPGRSHFGGLTLLLASAICALRSRRKRCRQSDSSARTSR